MPTLRKKFSAEVMAKAQAAYERARLKKKSNDILQATLQIPKEVRAKSFLLLQAEELLLRAEEQGEMDP